MIAGSKSFVKAITRLNMWEEKPLILVDLKKSRKGISTFQTGARPHFRVYTETFAFGFKFAVWTLRQQGNAYTSVTAWEVKGNIKRAIEGRH